MYIIFFKWHFVTQKLIKIFEYCTLFRMYEANSGRVTLGGHDISSLDPTWLRSRVVGFINQEPVLFATSIMENIRYSNPKASDEEVLPISSSYNYNIYYNKSNQKLILCQSGDCCR